MTDAQPQAKAVPPVVGGLVPYLTPSKASDAADFYVKAFAAREIYRVPTDENGRTMHIHLIINGNSLMLSDAYPDYGHVWEKPAGVSLHLQVDDVDTWYDRAVAAGAQATMPPALMFWGDRYGQLKDPFGFSWSIATTPKD